MAWCVLQVTHAHNPHDRVCGLLAQDVLLLACVRGIVYRSVDSGHSWLQSHLGLPMPLGEGGTNDIASSGDGARIYLLVRGQFEQLGVGRSRFLLII